MNKIVFVTILNLEIPKAGAKNGLLSNELTSEAGLLNLKVGPRLDNKVLPNHYTDSYESSHRLLCHLSQTQMLTNHETFKNSPFEFFA